MRGLQCHDTQNDTMYNKQDNVLYMNINEQYFYMAIREGWSADYAQVQVAWCTRNFVLAVWWSANYA